MSSSRSLQASFTAYPAQSTSCIRCCACKHRQIFLDRICMQAILLPRLGHCDETTNDPKVQLSPEMPNKHRKEVCDAGFRGNKHRGENDKGQGTIKILNVFHGPDNSWSRRKALIWQARRGVAIAAKKNIAVYLSSTRPYAT